MKIGDRLKSLRLMRGLTLEQVGEHLGVGKATVQRYESGLIDIKRTTAIKLGECLSASPAYIMGWTDAINGKAEKETSASDEAMMRAYHNAPPNIQAAIDNLLDPYKAKQEKEDPTLK